MASPFPPIDGGVVNAPPSDPNQPQSPTGISPPLGTAARSQATGTPVPSEPIQHSNQRANTHIESLRGAEDPITGRRGDLARSGEPLATSTHNAVSDKHGSKSQRTTGESFRTPEREDVATGDIPFPQVPARPSGDIERKRHEEEGIEAEAHLHRITSKGPVSSHSHIETCTETHPTGERSTGEKVKESASGAKGLVAAVHGVGEKIRGGFNAGVDRAFNDVCEPPEELFPHLGVLQEFKCDEDGEGTVWREESMARNKDKKLRC